MGGKASAGQVAAAGIYVGGRIATSAAQIAQAALISGAQIAAVRWMIDKQDDSWNKVSAKQIACVEQALDEFHTTLDGLFPEFFNAYPDVPEAARFVAPDPAAVQRQTMEEGLLSMSKTNEYMIAANHWHRINYLARMELLSPGFRAALTRDMKNIEALYEGKLPTSDLVELTTGVAEEAAARGKIGNCRATTATALGVSQLRLQREAHDRLRTHTDLLQRVSPVESEFTMDQLMLKPEFRVRTAIELAQLLQNDLQNFNNMKAQKAPAIFAQLQAKLQRAIARLTFGANKANMQNQFVPNYQALFMPAINNLLGAVFKPGWNSEAADSNYSLGGHLTPPGPNT